MHAAAHPAHLLSCILQDRREWGFLWHAQPVQYTEVRLTETMPPLQLQLDMEGQPGAHTLYGSFGSEVKVILKDTLDLQQIQVRAIPVD